MKSMRLGVGPGFTPGTCRPKGRRYVCRPVWAGVAFLFTIAAAGAYGAPQAAPQPAASVAKCAGTAAQNLATNALMTAAQGAEIIRELRAIQTLLQNGVGRGVRRPTAPQPVKMRIEAGWHSLGNARAPVTMIEFTDLQCPFCRRFQTSTFAEIEKDYIDTGKLRFIARSLPLPMHAYALGAAEAARCAGDQGKFWQFRDAVLDDQSPPTSDVLVKHARELGLDLQRFQACLSDAKHSGQINNERLLPAIWKLISSSVSATCGNS